MVSTPTRRNPGFRWPNITPSGPTVGLHFVASRASLLLEMEMEMEMEQDLSVSGF